MSRFVVLASLLSRARFSSSSTDALKRPTGIVVDLLSRSESPQTTAQLWKSAQESIKSKRHLKSLLYSLRGAGKVKTTPNVSGRSYGYSLVFRKPRTS